MQEEMKILLLLVGIMDLFVAWHLDFKKLDAWDYGWMAGVVAYFAALYYHFRRK